MHDGLLKICRRQQFDEAPFERVHSRLLQADFRYRFTKGKPVVQRKTGLAAQLVLIMTPVASEIVADIEDTAEGTVRTVTLLHDPEPGLRFEAEYVGKLQWAGPTVLRLVPKAPSIAPIEVGIAP